VWLTPSWRLTARPDHFPGPWYINHRAKVSASHSRPGHFSLGPKWEIYDARQAYERAQRKHDPLLSPHGFFRRLIHGSDAHAKEFFEKFGPLEGGPMPDRRRPVHGLVEFNLGFFWRRHLRFCLVARLWESRNDKKGLAAAWHEVAENRDKVSAQNDSLLGDSWMAPWDLSRTKFDDWVNCANFATLRSHAIWLVQRELNIHSKDSEVIWERGWEPTGERFRPTIRPRSLRAMIWEFFGLDTASIPWRRCPHCQRLFYPKRRDQFYCTSRQQGLASKRAYARRMRAAEKKSKRRKQ